jgi:hypothetical protein
MTYKMYLDDVRPMPADFDVHCTDYKSAVQYIQQFGLPIFISYDHDLGTEESGFTLAKFIVNYCIDNNKKVPKYTVHSANPVGAENIRSYMDNFARFQE